MKRAICGILAAGVLLLWGAYRADAWRGGGFPHGGVPHAGFHHDGFHGGGFHHGGHGRVFIGTRIFLGDPFWWDPWYPPYPSAPVIVQQTPPVYIQQSAPGEAATYWYYCEQSRGYYPYVKECPGGWMTVVPPGPSPAP